ncbi:hypothetical protein K435DRAFT_207177 [Dendrothele bispora CBS 962.96]|uniref:Uncharacterized protein n=1 Tax=Dendrothele bispora (strain CBS 962.96) TaxID=1314807 RepID=A0A4S8LUE6_DENBC|nr:hypothetical protein K435DRAFT_207177 [Dendrothele bispora CBS 962.96]
MLPDLLMHRLYSYSVVFMDLPLFSLIYVLVTVVGSPLACSLLSTLFDHFPAL